MFDIITFGSATQDIMIKPRKLTVLKYEKDSVSGRGVCFPLGSKIEVDEIRFNSGGGGTNTAATFSLQGFKTAYCGAIGNDNAGEAIMKELKSLKINTSLVLVTDKKATNHSVIILGDKQDRTILAYRGAAELMDKNNVPVKKLKTKWIYLAPLTGLLCDTFGDIVDFAIQHKIRIAANPSMAQLSLTNFAQITKKIDILILNQEEASFLTKFPFEREEEIFKKIDELCPGIAVMTKGGEGVVVSAATPKAGEPRLDRRDGKTVYSAKPHKERKVADTTGAGDSFASGFVSEFMRSADIEGAIQLGMANSEGCLSQIGAKNGLLKNGQNFEKIIVTKTRV